jgi:hypothetical protein
MSVTGRWEGKLIDVTGIAASLTLDLEDSKGEAKGDFSAAFLPEPGGCCEPVGPRQSRLVPSTPRSTRSRARSSWSAR